MSSTKKFTFMILEDHAGVSHRIGIAEVKKLLRKSGTTQADLASKIGLKNQSAVSHYLTGRSLPPRRSREVIAKVLEGHFGDTILAVAASVYKARLAAEEAKRQSGINPAAATAAAQVAAQQIAGLRKAANARVTTQGAPPPTRATGAPDDLAAPVEPADPPAKAEPPPQPDTFPAKAARKVGDLTRAAKEAGHIAVTFGYRKLQSWATAFQALRAEGFTYEAALSGSYSLAVTAKTPPGSEDERFLTETYIQVFGHVPTPPKPLKRDLTRHPSEALVEPFVKACVPIWLYGPAGTGKTYSAEAIASRLGRPYLRIQGSGDLALEHFVGGQGAKDGSTVQHYGPLPQMMKAGGVLILDEPSVVPPEILMVLQSVLEGKPLVLLGAAPEVIFPRPGFAVVATDNTVGLGEGIEYVGTRPMNEAFRDRFLFVHYAYMDEQTELAILAKNMKDMADRQGWTV